MEPPTFTGFTQFSSRKPKGMSIPISLKTSTSSSFGGDSAVVADERVLLTKPTQAAAASAVIHLQSPAATSSEDSKPSDEGKVSEGVEGAAATAIESSSSLEHEIQEPTAAEKFDAYAVPNKIPISHQVELGGHTKAVVCLSTAPMGNRVVTGSLDYNINIFDFGGMDSRHRAFRTIEVMSGHLVTSISHSPSGDRFVVATGSASPKVYDKEGADIIKFIKGDMYLRDLTNTKGHTMEVTCVQWHPIEKDTILTASLDGSVRIWDLLGIAHFGDLTSKHVLKLKGPTASQSRLGATSCCYTPTGNRIIAGASDGTVHIWNERKIYSRPDYIFKSDLSSTLISSVVVSPDGRFLSARALENSRVLVWEISGMLSATAKPVLCLDSLCNQYPTANSDFSADSSFLCCTTAERPAGSTQMKSLLCFYDIKSLLQQLPSSEFLPMRVPVPNMHIGLTGEAAAIFIKWQPKTNQILCGTSAGHTAVLFDPRVSTKGALLTSSRAPKRELNVAVDSVVVGEIINPNALPMFRNDTRPGVKKEKTGKVVAPEKPVNSGPGKATNNSFFFTQFLMSGRKMDTSRLEDPREALLKMDAAAKSDPMFLGSAYGQTQPSTKLADLTFEEEQEQFKKKQKM